MRGTSPCRRARLVSAVRLLLGERHPRRRVARWVDYRSAVFHSGSSLEQVFAIYGNVLQVDADGMVLNDADAQYRVAQWIRACCDPSFRVEPPFEAWETELHL
ncbi:DUF7677 family protein [Streptomyces sp. KLMMK]|uniref:DUF7677 family protein n=1 Tax=Streptomyces sp. KLMMK TaxID=3109353 RepID=UPI003FA6E015